MRVTVCDRCGKSHEGIAPPVIKGPSHQSVGHGGAVGRYVITVDHSRFYHVGAERQGQIEHVDLCSACVVEIARESAPAAP